MRYENLPKAYKRLVLKNRKKQRKYPQKSLRGSLTSFFTFTETPEGFDFWFRVVSAENINELPPLHKTRRVTYEENRR